MKLVNQVKGGICVNLAAAPSKIGKHRRLKQQVKGGVRLVFSGD